MISPIGDFVPHLRFFFEFQNTCSELYDKDRKPDSFSKNGPFSDLDSIVFTNHQTHSLLIGYNNGQLGIGKDVEFFTWECGLSLGYPT